MFTSADRPLSVQSCQLLAGTALTFTTVPTLATVGGCWAVHANEYGRVAALVLLTLFEFTVLFSSIGDRVMRPIVSLGSWLSRRADSGAGNGIGAALLLGCATGLLWAPCPGPTLGLILTSAAIKGATIWYNSSFAGLCSRCRQLARRSSTDRRPAACGHEAIDGGRRVDSAGTGTRRSAGSSGGRIRPRHAVLVRLSVFSTSTIEQKLVGEAGPTLVKESHELAGSGLPVEGMMPPQSGAIAWLNSPPLSLSPEELVANWYWSISGPTPGSTVFGHCLIFKPGTKNTRSRLVVIGVHSPEFAFEKELSNVQRGARDLGITYPVAVDSNFAIWQAFNNEYWPAHYFIDGQERICYHHFGEGDYDKSENVGRSGAA